MHFGAHRSLERMDVNLHSAHIYGMSRCVSGSVVGSGHSAEDTADVALELRELTAISKMETTTDTSGERPHMCSGAQ